MELEGVLRFKTCLRELIGTQELIWSEYIQSHSRENTIDFYFPLPSRSSRKVVSNFSESLYSTLNKIGGAFGAESNRQTPNR